MNRDLYFFYYYYMLYQLLCVQQSCSSTQSWGSVLPSIVETKDQNSVNTGIPSLTSYSKSSIIIVITFNYMEYPSISIYYFFYIDHFQTLLLI